MPNLAALSGSSRNIVATSAVSKTSSETPDSAVAPTVCVLSP